MTRFARIRRRPDHWPTPHARARARAAERLDGPLGLAEATWLDEHLAGCAACAAIAAQYVTDREALRGLRDAPPEPPRDLWARTAAAIEREAGSRPRSVSAEPGGTPGTPGTPLSADGRTSRPFRGLPVQAVSGVAVAAIVIAVGAVSTGLIGGGTGGVAVIDPPATAAVAPSGGPEVTGTDMPPTVAPQPTPLLADAGDVAWLRRSADGSLAFTNAPIDKVCPVEGRSGCAALGDDDEERLDLTATPKYVISSPIDRQAVIVSDDGRGGQELVVVSLPDVRDGGQPRPTPDPGQSPMATPTETPSAPPTDSSTPTLSPTPTPTPEGSDPVETPDPVETREPVETPEPVLTPEPTVDATVALASDITLVGESAAFSRDGAWFAFTARATDDASGPDVYVWRVGDTEATRLTDDGISTFASWAGGAVVVSRPADPSALEATAAVSLTIDPATGDETALEGALWRPTVDPSGARAVAWVGSVTFDAAARTWRPAEGRVALVTWPPVADAEPLEPLIEGPAADLDVRWDETGAWVAVWIADSLDSDIGRLSLFRVDPETGQLDELKGAPTEEPALAGFSIGQGRVAWVGPSGEDGEGSHIHVAAWVGRDVGTAESVPGQGIVVVR